MKTLEQLHFDTIENAYGEYNYMFNSQKAASKSAEITEQIAIEFSEWCANSHFHYYYNGEDWNWANAHTQEYFSTKDLFQEFLKTGRK